MKWRPIQEHVFPWEPHELLVACFYQGPESELKPEVAIFEATCSKGDYFAHISPWDKYANFGASERGECGPLTLSHYLNPCPAAALLGSALPASPTP